MTAETTELSWLVFGKQLPAETEDVWTWTIYEDRSIHLFEGKWAGARRINQQTLHVIDGYSEPGTSGGVTVNAKGEIVSVLVALANAMADSRGAQFVRALVLVQPVVGGLR